MTTDEAPVTDSFHLVGTTVADKLRIERCVAEGGFGVVYTGTFLSLEKRIALKVLKVPREFNAEAQQEFIDRFALEAKTIARMSHPAIVQVLDYGVSKSPSGSQIPWMALEWLDGETLDDFIVRRRGSGGLEPGEVLEMLRPVLDALAVSHEEGIAHRDIKPGNIMITQGRRGRSLRLMDFGIAKLMEEGENAGSGHTRTRTALQAYSPQYAAPEQVSGLRTGPWTDVHAMALIVCELITDIDPYRGADATQLLGAVISPWRPTPASVGIDVGPWEPVLQRALSLTPADRFPNARAFLEALEAELPKGRAPARTATGAAASPTSRAVPNAPTSLENGHTGPAISMQTVTPTPTPSLGTLESAVLDSSASGRSKGRGALIVAGLLGLLVVAGGGVLLLRTRGVSHAEPPVPTTRMTAARPPSLRSPVATMSATGTPPTAPVPTAPSAAPGNPTVPAAPTAPTNSAPPANPAAPASPANSPAVSAPAAPSTAPSTHHAAPATHSAPSNESPGTHRRRYQVF